jgi:hypothetical protein
MRQTKTNRMTYSLAAGSFAIAAVLLAVDARAGHRPAPTSSGAPTRATAAGMAAPTEPLPPPLRR